MLMSLLANPADMSSADPKHDTCMCMAQHRTQQVLPQQLVIISHHASVRSNRCRQDRSFPGNKALCRLTNIAYAEHIMYKHARPCKYGCMQCMGWITHELGCIAVAISQGKEWHTFRCMPKRLEEGSNKRNYA